MNDTQIVLINLDTRDGIFVRHAPEGVTLAAWSQLITRFETKNPKAISQREFHFGGEHFICFEENFDTKLDHRYPIDCRSEGGLAVNFMPSNSVGKQHDAMFYALLQSIRKL